MTSSTLIALALSCGASPAEARLIDGIAWRESSRRIKPSGSNDSGLAFGLFQFHRARWEEMGGDPARWGTAAPKEQVAAMLATVRKCQQRAKREKWQMTPARLVILVGRYHNRGHCYTSERLKHTAYTLAVWLEIQRRLADDAKRN